MPVPRAGALSMPSVRQAPDVVGAIDAAFQGASSLLANAYQRKLARRQQELAAAARQQMHEDRMAALEERQAARAADEENTQYQRAFQERKFAADQANARADRAAKGIREGAPPTTQVTTPAGETMETVDTDRYDDIPGLYYIDRQQTPEAVAARAAAGRQASRREEIEIREHNVRTRPARIRTSARGSAEATDAKARRSYVAQRVKALTTTKLDRDGDPVPGTGLSLDAATRQATTEWEAINQPAQPLHEAPGASPNAPAPGVSTAPAGSVDRRAPTPRLRKPAAAGKPTASASPAAPQVITPDQRDYLVALGAWDPARYEVA